MWLLTGKTVIDYLLSVKYETFSQIELLEDMSISEINNSTRNNVLVVTSKENQFICKQIKKEDTNSINRIRNEYIFYKHHKKDSNLFFFDRNNHVIIFKSEKNLEAVSLEIFINGYRDFNAKAIQILSKLHNYEIKNCKLPIPGVYKPKLLVQSDRYFLISKFKEFENPFVREIVKWLKENDETFQTLSTFWDKYPSLIHRDIKVSNFLHSSTNFDLIDWEDCAIGNKYWDLADYLFNHYRYVSGVVPSGYFEDNTADVGNVQLACLDFLKLYSKSLANEDLFYAYCYNFFIVRIVENYLSMVLNNKFVQNQEQIEFKIFKDFSSDNFGKFDPNIQYFSNATN
jgi:thiamine kinase-like enzyme